MKARNCFDTSIVEDDAFLDMSAEAQLLYFHATAHADADGHIVGISRVVRSYGMKPQHLQELYDAGLFLDVDGQAFVAHHWVNNGFDGRYFERTMKRCAPFMNGRLRFAGEDGKSRYVLSTAEDAPTKRRQNDADMNCSEMVCCDGGLVCNANDDEMVMLSNGGIAKGGEDNTQDAMTETEAKILENNLTTLCESGFDYQSTKDYLLDAYAHGGANAMFKRFLDLQNGIA